MTEELTAPPLNITAGDSIAWTISHDDYPAGDSWVLSYVLLNSSAKIEISSSASGDDHEVSLAAATTADYTTGVYQFAAYMTKGSDRYTVDTGSIEILANYATQTTLDTRSTAKKMLDAIDSLLVGKASKDVFSYSIGGRSLTSLTIEELESWRDKYAAKYRKEQIANGDIKRKIIKTQFSGVS